MKYLLPFSAIVGVVLAESRTTAPSGCLTVGSGATYTTVQDAVDAASDGDCIFLDAGTYNEQVYIQSSAGALTIYGYTEDTSSYSGNKAIISSGISYSDVSNDDETATLRAWSENFLMYNVNVENTAGEGEQALALSASAGNQGYYGCQFLGYQDTVLAETGYQVYGRCYIEGAVDFIFGQEASAWFDQCDIGVLARSQGTITGTSQMSPLSIRAGSPNTIVAASGRSSDDAYYYVINNSTVAAASGASVTSGAYYLGRPWRDYARVIFQDSSLSDVINAAGWEEWSSSDPRTDNVEFGEYGNTGDGSDTSDRASFSEVLSAPIDMATVLGSTSASFIDSSYLS